MSPVHDGQPNVLVMDANERNADLLSDFLQDEGYEPDVVTDLDAAADAVADASRVAFAIVDIDRFHRSVWPYCDRLREENVRFIVLSGLSSQSVRRESHERGAHAFLTKPVSKQALRELIQTLVDP